MPADRQDETPPRQLSLGFSSYADEDAAPARGWDGPRLFRPLDEDEAAEGPAGPAWPGEDAPPRRSPWLAPMAALAVVGGAGLALLLTHGPPRPAPREMAPTSAEARSATLPVEVAAAAQAPPAPAGPPLEVLSAVPASVQAPRPAVRLRLPEFAPREAPGVATGVDVADAAPERLEPPRPAPPPRRLETPPPREAADCTGSPGARMVCGDERLAAADRRMRRAYEAALRAGVSEEDLAADQDDWRQIRDDAARYSRQAVANVYRQRIDELEALARPEPE